MQFNQLHSPQDCTVPHTDNSRDDTAAPATPAARTVLYVEDHPVNVLLMQALFTKRPELRLVIATTAEAGLRSAIEARPDLLLLDLQLPDGHGVELLQRMREVEHLRHVTAIAVTAEAVSDLTAQGFREIWHKPMDLHRTLLRLDWMLTQAEAERNEAMSSSVPVPVTVTVTAPETALWAAGARVRRAVPQPIPFPTAAHLQPDVQRPVEAARAHSVAE